MRVAKLARAMNQPMWLQRKPWLVRRVWILLVLGVRMVVAMLRRPPQRPALHGARAEQREQELHGARRAERACAKNSDDRSR